MADVTSQEVLEANSTPMPQEKPKRGPFSIRNFRLLWTGETISLLGDQFHYVALSWLVLQLTGSGFALGTVLMAAGVPRVLFMLVGGVMTDRFSPRMLMMVSNAVRGILTLVLTVLVLTHMVQLWMLYILAVAFGTADAFFQPAFMSIVPSLVSEEQLQSSNAVVQASALITQAVGPGLAGRLLSVTGIGTVLAFAFDTLTFAVTTVTLSMMRGLSATKPKHHQEPSSEKPHSNVLADIVEGFRVVGRDPILPPLLIIVAVINFMFTGPISVGPAKLAAVRFVEGPQAFGAMMSAFGIGALVGMGLTAVVKPRKFGLLSLLVIGISGFCMIVIGYSTQLWMAVAAAGVMGATTGFVNVLYITWLQKRVAPEMMGRVMSMIGLASMGLGPISNAVAGFVVEIDVTLMFVAAGVLLLLTVALSTFNSQLRTIQN